MRRTSRPIVIAVAVAVALLASCATGDETLRPAPGPSPEAVVPGTEPSTSEAPSTDHDASDPDAAITPTLLCVDERSRHYFAYVNDADAPAVIELGADNQLTGGTDDDEPFVTEVFAPGRVSPAFWVSTPTGDPPVWTVTGPDGETRTSDTGEPPARCTDDLLRPTTPDDRVGGIEVDDVELLDDGDTVQFEVRLVGVPGTSRCHEAFEPDAVRVRIVDPATDRVVDGATVTSTWPLFLDPLDKGAARRAHVPLHAYVSDRCRAGDVVAESWPNGPLADLQDGRFACIVERPGGFDVEVDDSGCPFLPPTGGGRVRPG